MLVRVNVTTGADKNKLVVSERGKVQVSVTEKPQDNRANERVRELIARHYKVPIASVRIVKGHHSTGKILELRNQ
jgi:uncharacterized protein YggU (UPF0235/DUF167 family)